MFSEVFCHRNHLNKQVELAQSEAIAASAEVTLVEIELSAEMNQMQRFLDYVALVTGRKIVRRLLGSVQWVIENGEDATDESEEQDADDEDSNDEGGSEERQADAKNDNPNGSGNESEGDEQSSDDDEDPCGADAESWCVIHSNLNC
jgi:cobalamin biosynthesis protein CobT